MTIFLVIGRHAPADCPMHNEKAAMILSEWGRKNPELMAKHGINLVGAWIVNQEHLAFQVYEAPSADAMQAYLADLAVLPMSFWQTIEVKQATTVEEHAQLLQQLMQQKQA
ncbi:MAG: DUF3303 family protein [Halobacteriota archaeon]